MENLGSTPTGEKLPIKDNSKKYWARVDGGTVPAIRAWHLPRIVGRLKAFELCFSGTPISGVEAERLGIINHVFPAADLADETQKMAERFINKSPAVMKLGREIFYRTMDMEFEKAIKSVGDACAQRSYLIEQRWLARCADLELARPVRPRCIFPERSTD